MYSNVVTLLYIVELSRFVDATDQTSDNVAETCLDPRGHSVSEDENGVEQVQYKLGYYSLSFILSSGKR